LNRTAVRDPAYARSWGSHITPVAIHPGIGAPVGVVHGTQTRCSLPSAISAHRACWNFGDSDSSPACGAMLS
jgi:hypothetical protein